MLSGWIIRLRALFKRTAVEQDLDDELRFHLERQIETYLKAGVPRAEAVRRAQLAFGGLDLAKEECREARGIRMVDELSQDLRYAARVLARNPGFTAVAIVSLALGIGANTAIFQLLNAVRLQSLPVARPQELAEIRIVGGNHGMGVNPGPYGQLTRPIWLQLREEHEPFSSLFAWGARDLRVGQPSDLRRVNGLRVSGEFFQVLGVQPWRGRLIGPGDEGACPESVAVVSHKYWQAEMGARDLAASTVMVDGQMKEVIGVTPPEFFGLAIGDSFDIALPFCQPKELRRDLFDVAVMGRLRPGWTLARASGQLAAVSPGIFAATVPTGYSTRTAETYKSFRLAAHAASGGVSVLRERFDSALTLLLATTGLVLLIACANLANLTLARATTREREMAVRLALGASRGRLLRQLIVESGLLAASGAALGTALAPAAGGVLVASLSTESASVTLPLAIDWRVLLFAAAAAASTCAIFGVAPALRASSAEPAAAIRTGGRATGGAGGRLSLQRLLVVVQIAVSLVLVVGALLFVGSFRNLMTFDPGMRQGGISIALVGYPQLRLARDRYGDFQRQLLDEVRSVPGILGAATTTNVPLLGSSWGHGIRIGSAEGSSRFTWVSPGYFRMMGIPLIAGRDFSQDDTAVSPYVAVVNQAFVRQFVGAANPIGQTLRTSPEPNYPATTYEIVGVIPDTRYNDLRGDTPPMTFAPASQFPAMGPWAAIMIYSDVPPAAAIAMVKQRLAERHPQIAMEFHVFQNQIRDRLVRERLMALLSGSFGVLAVALTTVGLYGVIAYLVARRRNEIGIRLALGASRRHVVGMVMRETGRVLIAGLGAGTVLALIAGRGAGALLFHLKPHDPSTLLAAAGVLAALAAVASFLPARRAAKLDPMTALRCE